MKLIDKIKDKKIISIEVLPPERGENIDSIFKSIDELLEFPIDFISVTRHPPFFSYIEKNGNILKTLEVERPGTIGTTVALKNRYNIDIIPHLIAYGNNKYQIEDLLIDLNLIGIENLLIIRGDFNNEYIRKIILKEQYCSTNYKDFESEFINKKIMDTIKLENDYYFHSVDLVKQVYNMNNGNTLYGNRKIIPTNFCIGVAAYPEKHYESPNINHDLKYLKEKIDSGANYIITQMVFDFKVVKRFIELMDQKNLKIPIIIGIKPVVSLKTLYNLPKKFFINIPEKFIKKMENARSKEEEFKIGVNYFIELIKKILELKVDGIHFFTMGKSLSTKTILKELFS